MPWQRGFNPQGGENPPLRAFSPLNLRVLVMDAINRFGMVVVRKNGERVIVSDIADQPNNDEADSLVRARPVTWFDFSRRPEGKDFERLTAPETAKRV